MGRLGDIKRRWTPELAADFVRSFILRRDKVQSIPAQWNLTMVAMPEDSAPAPEGRGLATDAAPKPIATDADMSTFNMPVTTANSNSIPVMPGDLSKKFLQPSASALAESELIQSFFEGVPHAEGQRRYEAYLQRKAELRIARMSR